MDALFFITSKIVGWGLSPFNIMFVLICFAIAFLVAGRFRPAKWLVGVVVVMMACLGVVPISYGLVQRLENSVPNSNIDYDEVAGIIVLGGGIDGGLIPYERDQVSLNTAAERMTATVQLAREHPCLKIIFTGFSGSFFPKGVSEAEAARRFFEEQRIASDRIIYENRSRNTVENAQFSRPLMGDRTWILLTSASHMRRAQAAFEKSGARVIPLSVDYQTGSTIPWGRFDVGEGDRLARIAIHEYVGIFVYWITGRA